MTGGIVFDPAWPDESLGAACVDLQAGTVGAARDVLAGTRQTWDLERRAHVSAVLAAVAARSDVTELWLRDEPQCPDAWLLCARVAVVRALALFDREGPTRQATEQLRAAMALCRTAYAEGGYDPTVWVAVLTLLRTRLWPSVEPVAPELAPVRGIAGPWDLVERVIVPLMPGHREAGSRLLAYFSARHGGRNEDHVLVARWLSGQVEPGHPWRLLPAVVALEHDAKQERASARQRSASSTRAGMIRDMLTDIGPAPSSGVEPPETRHRREQLEAALKAEEEPESWEALRNRMGRAAEETYVKWFAARTDGRPEIPAGVPITDVSLLAWGLHASGQRDRAGRVLRFMGPYASRYPWSRFGDPAAVLEQVRRECAGVVALRAGPG